MTIVNLIDDYFVEIKEPNYILKQRYIGHTQDGKRRDASRKIGNYSSVQHCVEKLLKLEQGSITEGKEISLRAYIGMIDNTNKRTVQALSDLITKNNIT